MARKQTIQEWQNAVDVLTSYAAEFSSMEDEILPLLKYSYDNLKEEQVKSCLLYCALFPEDYKIYKETLIEYWICEGIIDASGGIERAENKGHEIIGSIVRASLLMMEAELSNVRMHDVVRDMALWIASDLEIQKEAYIVHAGVRLNEMPKVKNWKVVKRMSLMNNKIVHLTGSPECLQLKTFLLQNNLLEDISSEYFKSMPKLHVLDLSGNEKLSELPDVISKLVSLRYLNLSGTGIRHLRMDRLQELKKLIRLELPRLSSIAGISKLQNLKVLRLTFPDDLSEVKELETLESLEILFTIFQEHPLPLKKFLSSHKLTSCTRRVIIKDMDVESSGIALPQTMDKLRDFRIFDCRVSEIKICNKSKTFTPLRFSSLSLVVLYNCECLKELTFLMFAPNLKDLIIIDGTELEDIINKEKACGGVESRIVPIFTNLNRLVLMYLPKLKNIYWSPLPTLKKLPLNSQSGKQSEDGLIITYEEKEWIEGVQWEDEATKTRFLSSCQQSLSFSVSWGS